MEGGGSGMRLVPQDVRRKEGWKTTGWMAKGGPLKV